MVACEWLDPPAQVVTFGLTAAEMNGRVGVVTRWDAGRARYAVELEGGAGHPRGPSAGSLRSRPRRAPASVQPARYRTTAAMSRPSLTIEH